MVLVQEAYAKVNVCYLEWGERFSAKCLITHQNWLQIPRFDTYILMALG